MPLAELNQQSFSDVYRDPGREIVLQNCKKKNHLNWQRWQCVQVFFNNNDWESCSCHAGREIWHISSILGAYWDMNVSCLWIQGRNITCSGSYWETWRQLLARRKHNSVCYRRALLSPILAEDEALTNFLFFPRMFCSVSQVEVLWKLKEGFRQDFNVIFRTATFACQRMGKPDSSVLLFLLLTRRSSMGL